MLTGGSVLQSKRAGDTSFSTHRPSRGETPTTPSVTEDYSVIMRKRWKRHGQPWQREACLLQHRVSPLPSSHVQLAIDNKKFIGCSDDNAKKHGS